MMVNDSRTIVLNFNDYNSTFKRILYQLCSGITIKEQFSKYDTIIIEDYDYLLEKDKKLVDKIMEELSDKHIVYDYSL